MGKNVLYVKLNQNILAKGEDVFLKDVGSVYCEDKTAVAKAKALKVWHFQKDKKLRVVISVVKIIEELTKVMPGIEVQSLGEADVILEYLPGGRTSMFVVWIKIIFVAAICFFGTAFSIMAFHNDIGIQNVFSRIYEMVTGETSNNNTILEWSYSIGLGLGIIVFYNHIGGRRLSKDPTPLEVEMRNYERDVNTTLVETAEREGKEKDVE